MAKKRVIMTEDEKDDLIEILKRAGINYKKCRKLLTEFLKMITKEAKPVEERIQELLIGKLTQLMNEDKGNNSKILIGAIIENENIAEEITRLANETVKALRETNKIISEVKRLNGELAEHKENLNGYILKTELDETSIETANNLKQLIKETEDKIEDLLKQIKGKKRITKDDFTSIGYLLGYLKKNNFWKNFFGLSNDNTEKEFNLKKCSCGGLIITREYKSYSHQFTDEQEPPVSHKTEFCIHCGRNDVY